MSPTPRARTRADGSTAWQVVFRHDGRQTSETFHSRRDAARFARDLETLGPATALDVLTAWQHATSAATVAEYAAEHVESLSGVQPGTRRRYGAYIRRDLGALGHLPLDAVTPDAVARWVNAMTATGASGKTIANKHGFLAAVFERAVARGDLPANPCAHTRLPRTVREPMTFLTHGEFARFLDCFEPRWQPLVLVLFGTGLRWSEATALRVGDVDLDAATVTVNRAWKDGPGRTLGPPKSARSRRTVTMPPEVRAVVAPLCVRRPADAWLFTNEAGGPVRHQTFHGGPWQAAVRVANGERGPGPSTTGRTRAPRRELAPLDPPLGKRPRIHDARHTCASWLLGGGAPMIVVQHHLGHESITTTSDRYGHLMPDARLAVSAVLSAALSSAVPQIER